MKTRIMSDIKTLAALYRPTWPGISAAIEKSGVPTMQVTPRSAREDLKATEAALAEKRGERPDLIKARDKAKDEFVAADEKGQDSEAFKSAEAAVKALGECDDSIDQLVKVQEMSLRLVGEDPATRPVGDPRDPREASAGWDSASLFADKDVVARLATAANSAGSVGQVELGEVVNRDGFAQMFGAPMAADIEPTNAMRRGASRGIVPQLRRPLTLLDIIPTGTMDNNTFPFVREEGSLTGEAKGVQEGVRKPQGGFTFVDDEAIARTIAEFLKIKKQALSDVAALRSTMDSRLRYALERKLESQVLAGKGTDPELKGILPTTGLGVVKFAAGKITADQTLLAMTTILLANAVATGIVMHPLDWANTIMQKATGGDEQYYGGGPFAVTPAMLWGVPLIPSPAIKEGEVLVGDFGIGVQLLIREGINVLLSDSNEDDFVTNRVTMLGECRAANVVWRPPAFCRMFLSKASEEAAA